MPKVHKHGTKHGETPRRLPYPEKYVSQRSGNKVGWYTYATIEEANEGARIARHNAEIKSNEGYDFGFQSPGTITKVDAGWEVCIP